MKTKTKVLFLLKKRNNINSPYWHGNSSGLFTSVKFLNDMLNDCGIRSKMVEVVDNNCIDREVTKFKPTHCFIEALWVVPEKFDVLKKLHPKVKWIVRVHSNLPFLSLEGSSMEWILKYIKIDNVAVAFNNVEITNSIKYLCGHREQEDILYLPNYYDIKCQEKDEPWYKFITAFLSSDRHNKHINIGCFGAIRSLKNHLIQAVAAIKFANSLNKNMSFHINVGRIEGYSSQSILKNLRALFANSKHHRLAEHPWLERENFLKLAKTMDMGMQVSLSETFNIVAADLTSMGVPMVVSDEISWMDERCFAHPTDYEDIYETMLSVWQHKRSIVDVSRRNLVNYCLLSNNIWFDYLIKGKN